MFAAVLGLSTAILLVLLLDPLRLLERRVKREDAPAGSERFRRYEENRRRNEKLAEIDRLLDKVARDGLQSLSRSERTTLERLSKEIHGG
jgi:hypothetical protein